MNPFSLIKVTYDAFSMLKLFIFYNNLSVIHDRYALFFVLLYIRSDHFHPLSWLISRLFGVAITKMTLNFGASNFNVIGVAFGYVSFG